MVSKFVKYIVIIYFCLIANVLAGTDLLSNALTQTNTFLKEAGNVQREYSKELRKITTRKINPDALLGENAKIAKEKAEKTIDKANSIKELADKIKKVEENTQAEGSNLMERYNKLNEKLLELKTETDATLAKGREIQEKYKTGKAKLDEALDTVNDIKNKSEGEAGIEEDVDETIDNMAGIETSNEDFEDTEMVKDDGFRKVVNPNVINANSNVMSVKPIVDKENDVLTQNSPMMHEEIIKQPSYNKADAIGFASNTVSQTDVQLPSDDMMLKLNVDNINSKAVSVSDVMSVINNPDMATVLPTGNNDINSTYDIKEQLEITSNYAPVLKNKDDQAKVNNIDERSEISVTSSIREKFKHTTDTSTGDSIRYRSEEKIND